MIEMSNETFNVFISGMKSIASFSRNIIIKDSKVIQFSDGRQQIIYMDLEDIIGKNIDISMALASSKLDLMKLFNKSEKIKLDVNDDHIAIGDEKSLITFNMGDESKLDRLNPIMSIEQYKKTYDVESDENTIISGILDSDYVTRLLSVSKNIGTNTFYFSFNDDGIKLLVDTITTEDSEETKSVSAEIATFDYPENNILKDEHKLSRCKFPIYRIAGAHSKELKYSIFYTTHDPNKVFLRVTDSISYSDKKLEIVSLEVSLLMSTKE